jgi:hypothetical protein
MTTLQQIHIDLEGIAHVLADNRLRVPAFQRSYAWEEAHVTDLLQDLSTAIKDSGQEYFLGSIVVSTEHSGTLEVIDGQQRLATVTIILSRIRDYFIAQSEQSRADTLESEYLLKRDLRTQEAVPQLTLNETDNDFFQKAVLSRPGSPDRGIKPTRPSHERLGEAARLVERQINSLVATTKSPVDALLDWVDYLRKNTRIILVRVPDDANAFTIFETLNDRGLDLAISDLLKNYLFYRAENRLPEVQAAWSAMIGALSAVGSDTSVVDYIRHYWSSINGLTRERELYSAIRKKISSKQAAIDLAHNLESSARRYAAIISHAHEFWGDYGSGSRQHIETINLLRMVQVRPLLLAVLDKFGIAETKKALRFAVSWGVRFLIHGGLGGGVLEREYCDRAKEINSNTIKTAAQLAKAMATAAPSDKEFEAAFSTATVSQTYLARYYLRALEKRAGGEIDPELIPNPNEEDVNLEHILPIKPEKNWPQFDEESAKVFHRRLGNMALIQQKLNSALRSAPFSKKKVVYANSKFKLTTEVAAENQWDAATIDARQKRLAKLAVETWPIRGSAK